MAEVSRPAYHALLEEGRALMANVQRKLPHRHFTLADGPFRNGNLAAIGYWDEGQARWRPCAILVPPLTLPHRPKFEAAWHGYEHELFIDGAPALGDIPWPAPPADAFDPHI